MRKKDIGFHSLHLHFFIFIFIPALGEQDVQSHAAGALCPQLPQDPAIDLTRPGQIELKIGAECALAEDRDGVIADVNEAKLIADGRLEVVGDLQSQIVSYPFQPLQKLDAPKPAEESLRQAGERGRRNANPQRSKFNGL